MLTRLAASRGTRCPISIESLEPRRLLSGFPSPAPFDNPQVWRLNEGAQAAVVGNSTVLRLTPDTPYWTTSAFNRTPVPIDRFDDVGFDFRIAGDYGYGGFTFCLQANDPYAVGYGTHSLGYARINSSMAIKFDAYDPRFGSIFETGLYFNGERPKNSRYDGDIDLSPTLGSLQGILWRVRLSYDGSDLTMQISDPANQQRQFSHTWAVGLAALLGSDTAYVGFTASTSEPPLQQDIHSFHWRRDMGNPDWAVDATNSNDERALRRNGDNVEFLDKNGNLLGSRRFDSIANLIVNALDGDDALTLDFSGGPLVPDGKSITLNGGPGADSIKIKRADGRAISVSNTQLTISSLPVNLDSVESTVFAGSTQLSSLAIAGSTNVALAPGGNFMKLDALSMSPSASLHLADGNLILPNTNPATIGTLIKNKQLKSNPAPYTTLAAAINNKGNNTPLFATFPKAQGVAVGITDVLVKYTYAGDANLDGVVNADDYFQIDSGFIAQKAAWYSGDFNYDRTINADDYFLVDSAYIAQSSPLAGSSSSAFSVLAWPLKPSPTLFAPAHLLFFPSICVVQSPDVTS